MEIFAVCVKTFEPIKIRTCSSPQNDRLNLSFVKDINVVGNKMARNGRKTAIWASRKFDAPPSSTTASTGIIARYNSINDSTYNSLEPT